MSHFSDSQFVDTILLVSLAHLPLVLELYSIPFNSRLLFSFTSLLPFTANVWEDSISKYRGTWSKLRIFLFWILCWWTLPISFTLSGGFCWWTLPISFTLPGRLRVEVWALDTRPFVFLNLEIYPLEAVKPSMSSYTTMLSALYMRYLTFKQGPFDFVHLPTYTTSGQSNRHKGISTHHHGTF